jgi:hypothetical protein
MDVGLLSQIGFSPLVELPTGLANAYSDFLRCNGL